MAFVGQHTAVKGLRASDASDQIVHAYSNDGEKGSGI